MHNREGSDHVVDGKGFLPKESIKTHLPARQDMKQHEYREICSVFNVIDIDGDNSISRQELNENLTCIASMLGIEDETDLGIKIGLLFLTNYGDRPCRVDDTVDKATFTSFFICSNEDTDSRDPGDDLSIIMPSANEYLDYDAVSEHLEHLSVQSKTL